MKVPALPHFLICGFAALIAASCFSPFAAGAKPNGSLTIDHISDIKYPTQQQWSLDNKTIAFLWEAAGKQDIYTVQAGSPPLALTDSTPASPIGSGALMFFAMRGGEAKPFLTCNSCPAIRLHPFSKLTIVSEVSSAGCEPEVFITLAKQRRF